MRRKPTPEENRKYYLRKKARLLESENPKSCLTCQGEFYKSKVGFYKFCSGKCKAAHEKDVICQRRNAKRRGDLHSVYEYGLHWEAVWGKCEGVCQGCGQETPKSLRGTVESRAPEVDHILPISIGGAHISDNLQILCHSCNSRKGNSVSESDARRLKHLARAGVDPEFLARKNLGSLMRSNTSGYRGVYFDKKMEKWVGRFFDRNGRRVHVGTFETARQAGKAVEKMKLRVYGYD